MFLVQKCHLKKKNGKFVFNGVRVVVGSTGSSIENYAGVSFQKFGYFAFQKYVCFPFEHC